MRKDSKIFVAGNGLVGSAIQRRLKAAGYTNVHTRKHRACDLTRQFDTEILFSKENFEYVFLAAAKVGGIHANSTFPADFIYSNLQIQNNVIHTAFKFGIKKLLFLGSSCIYPKFCEQPMKEESLLAGKLEPTNEPYAVAKIAGIKLCQAYNRQFGTNFISVMPTNLYGINDNYHNLNAHVLPALLQRFHLAKINNQLAVTIWGDGSPKREFMYADDCADACIFLMNNSNEEIVNIGTGEEVLIKDLADMIKTLTKFNGNILFDEKYPNGTLRKVVDCDKLHRLGWKYKVSLQKGLGLTYADFLNNGGRR